VPPLQLPKPERAPTIDSILGSEAVRLFVARASHIRPGLCGNQDATDEFMSVLAGTLRVQDFYDPSNIERYLLAAATNPSE
jgi:hypothetical protein